MTGMIIVLTVSIIFSLAAVAMVLKLSHKKAWYDHINERKIHSGDIPRLGGIGFALAFIVIAALIGLITRKLDANLRFLPCLAALLITLISGVWDDFRPMVPRHKLWIQFLAALCVIIPGYIFRRITYIESGFLSGLGWLGYPITFLWIVGLINAINFIDGVDGLAGGLSALITLFFGLIFFSYSRTSSAALFCASLLGVMLGFLAFNMPIPKAKIFMGDGGSQFLGCSLALLPLLKDHNSHAALPVPYAAALLAIPIFDTIAAVWRRVRDGRKIASPDKAHVHHKLINLGLSVWEVDAVLYSLQILLGILTFIAVRLEGWPSLYVLGAAYAVAIIFFGAVHFLNRKVMAKIREGQPGAHTE
ncbi:undecaprenyl-phosphate alpha-N-acetylglucosaminyl 1-phosphate transferase [Spirochaetia bacterium]|nr:undecaprenyl-phosphate alpha-N-acetylglucosaminyl 1-phosphate transferase [Spirochaetia bacterium]